MGEPGSLLSVYVAAFHVEHGGGNGWYQMTDLISYCNISQIKIEYYTNSIDWKESHGCSKLPSAFGIPLVTQGNFGQKTFPQQ